MDSLGKWFWLIEILRFFFADCSLSVTEFHNCRQKNFFVVCGFFFPVLQLRKCLPSLEINLGIWPPCCKIRYNTAVNIEQLIDRDIFPPACMVFDPWWVHKLCVLPEVSVKCQPFSSYDCTQIFFYGERGCCRLLDYELKQYNLQ